MSITDGDYSIGINYNNLYEKYHEHENKSSSMAKLLEENGPVENNISSCK